MGRFAASGSRRMASKTTGFLHKSRFALPKQRIEAGLLRPSVTVITCLPLFAPSRTGSRRGSRFPACLQRQRADDAIDQVVRDFGTTPAHELREHGFTSA